MDNITCLHITTCYHDYRFSNRCVVYADSAAGDYPLWAEEIKSNNERDIIDIVRRAEMFADALVNQLNG